MISRPGLRGALGVFLACALAAPPAFAAEVEQGCGDEVEADRFQHLRQLTLDLLGRVPTEAELEALIPGGDLTEAEIRALLKRDEVETFLRRYHTDLFWPAMDPADLVSGGIAFLIPALFVGDMNGDPTRLFSVYPAIYKRGALVPCADEPAQFDDEGNPIFEPWPDGTQREGWVMVSPYWAPDTQVKVCALDARMDPVNSYGQPCDAAQGMVSGECGCGPELRHCVSPESAQIITNSLREQLVRMFIAPIREGGSYFDALTHSQEDLNGPLLHYYRYLAKMAVNPLVQVPPVPVASLPPDVPFTDMGWQAHQRSPEQSGVLTSLAFLLRFQTGRARANRFYSSMLCTPFVAPPELELPSPNEACSDEPDLRKRCGCNACHAALEPAAAYWGRFSESGTMYLSPFSFPSYRADCATCMADSGQCDFICQRFYLTEAGHPKEAEWLGTLQSHVFASDAELDRIAGGPRKLVEDTLETGAMPRCVVQRVYSTLMRRDMSAQELQTLLPDLVQRFEASGYDFLDLVAALVTHPSYRRLLR